MLIHYKKSGPTGCPDPPGGPCWPARPCRQKNFVFSCFFFCFVSHWIESISYPLSSGPCSSTVSKFTPTPLCSQSSAKP